jgi:hypothetical protein
MGHPVVYFSGRRVRSCSRSSKLEACERAGWLSHLQEAVNPDALAALAGVERERVDVLAVLIAAEIVEEADGLFSLSAQFAALTAGASEVSLHAVLGLAELQRTRLTAVLDGSDQKSMGGEQALTLARAWGMRPTQGSADLSGADSGRTCLSAVKAPTTYWSSAILNRIRPVPDSRS